MILGIDTCAGQCAVALIGGDRTWRRSARMTRGHAEALFPMIEEVLHEAGVRPGDLTRIAVCTGPGSFTGIRAGIAAARGLALGLDIPAVGVTRFQALRSARTTEVAVPMRARTWAVDAGDGTPPVLQERTGITGADEQAALPDPETIARLGQAMAPGPRPAPFYLRPADAMPSADLAPTILDP